MTGSGAQRHSDAGRVYGGDVPDEVVQRLRAICAELPDAYEEPAWVGVRWRVRKKTFAHVLTVAVDGDDPRVVLTFRSDGEELEALRRAGPPFLVLGWGRDALGLDLGPADDLASTDQDGDTDWTEVRELVTDSFCVMAPKKLVARVHRPPPVD